MQYENNTIYIHTNFKVLKVCPNETLTMTISRHYTWPGVDQGRQESPRVSQGLQELPGVGQVVHKWPQVGQV